MELGQLTQGLAGHRKDSFWDVLRKDGHALTSILKEPLGSWVGNRLRGGRGRTESHGDPPPPDGTRMRGVRKDPSVQSEQLELGTDLGGPGKAPDGCRSCSGNRELPGAPGGLHAFGMAHFSLDAGRVDHEAGRLGPEPSVT